MFFIKTSKTIKIISLIFLGIFCVCLNFAQADAPDPPVISLSASCLENSQYIFVTFNHIDGQNIKNYFIYRDYDYTEAVKSFDEEEIQNLSEGSFVSWSNYSVARGSNYSYEIRAINTNNEFSNFSTPVSITAPFCPMPELSLSTECYGLSPQIRLDWNIFYDIDNVNYISLYRGNNFCITNAEIPCSSNDDCPNEDCFSYINQFPNTYDYWINRNLENSQNYAYYIEVLGEGWSSKLEPNFITTLDCAENINPTPQPELTVTPTCIDDVKTMVLNWTKSENSDKYIIHKDSSEEGVYSKDIDMDTFFYNDRGSIGTLGEIIKDRTYIYRIEAKNNNPDSISAYSSSTIAVFTQDCSGQDPPGKPINLASESRCNGVDPVMRISWDTPTTGGNVSNYVIYRNVNDGTFNYYISIADTFYDDPNVIIGKPAGYYKYQIEAQGIGGSSPCDISNPCNSPPISPYFPQISSQEVSNCVPSVSPAMEIPVFHCSFEENPFVRIEWSQGGSVDPDTNYFNIYRKLGSGEYNLIKSNINKSVYLWDDDSVVSNIPINSYFYYVKAIGFGAGDSVSGSESVVVGWCDPTVPTVSLSKTCDGLGSSLVGISWAASKNLDHYEVSRDATLIYNGINTSYQDTVFGASDTYSYEVKAVGKNGTGITDTDSITTDDCAVLTGAPNIKAADSESRCELSYYPYFHLVWEQVSNAAYYQVYRQKNEAGEIKELIYTSPNGTTVSYDDSSINNPSISRVESGADYYYRVVAYKNADSISSDAVLFNNIDWCKPSQPQDFAFTRDCDGEKPEITLTWDDQNISSGKIGLYNSYNQGSYFENIKVTSLNGNILLEDNFNDGNYNGWTQEGGTWNALGGILKQTSNNISNYLLRGDAAWQDYKVDLNWLSGDNDSIGVMFHYQDSNNYYLFEANKENSYRRLIRKKDGIETELAKDNNEYVINQWYLITLRITGTNIEVYMDNSLVFNVAESSLNTDKYELYRRTDLGNPVSGDLISADAISPYINIVENNITYYYHLRPIGTDGNNYGNNYDAQLTVDSSNCASLVQPTISSISSECSGSSPYIDLTWESVTNAEYYQLHRIFDEVDEIISGCDTLSCNDNGVNSSSTYVYYVLACNMGGCSPRLEGLNPAGNDQEIEVEWCPPQEPSAFTVFPYCDGAGDSIVNLNWLADTTGNADYYELYRDGGLSGQIVLDNNLASNSNSYSDYSVENSTSYTYTLKIIGKDGTEIAVSENTTTHNCMLPGIPTIDTDVSIFQCDASEPYVHLEWANSTNAAADGYRVLRNDVRVDLPDDVAGFWHFNENSGTTVYDETMYNNDGDLINMDDSNWVQSLSGGGNDYALKFDGGNKYIRVVDSSNLHFSNALSVMFWMKVDTISETWKGLVGRGGGYPYRNYTLWLNSNKYLHFSYNNTSGSNITLNSPNNSISLNTWHHIAYTLDVSGGVMKIYIDGIQVATRSPSGNPRVNNGDLLIACNLDGGNGNFFDGIIDEVKVVSRALTQTEIQADYQRSESSLYQNTFYDDYGVVSDNFYNYKIVAKNIGGTSSDTLNSVYIDWCPPAAPSNLQASKDCDGAGNSEITLLWDADLLNAVDYYQIIRINGGTTVLENSLDGSSVSHTDSSPPDNSTTYDYSVVAAGKEGSWATSTVSITTDDCSLPNTDPDISISTSSCDNSIPYGYLKWNEVSNADYYEIYRGAEKISTTTGIFYSDYDIINTAIGVYLGNSFDYYIKARNFGGCSQGTSGNIFFNDPNSACKPFTPVLTDSEISCVAGGMGVLNAVADLRWYDFFPDSVSDYEVLISGNTTSTTAENYNSTDKKEYIDFEKILDEFFEGNTYSFILRSNPKNPIFSSIDSSPINLGVPNCGAPAKPILDEPIPSCDAGLPKISLNWEDDLDTDYYDVYFTKDEIPFNWNIIESSLFQSEYAHFNNASFPVELNTKYYYYVKAWNYESGYNISDTVSTTTPIACYNTPLKPIINSITGGCDGSSPREPYIKIKWDRRPEDNNTDYYEIWRTDNTLALNAVNILDNKDTFDSYYYIGLDSKGIDSTVVKNTQYEYYLIAVGSGGENKSATSTIITPDCEEVPEIPGDFSVVPDCYGYCNGGDDEGNACNEDVDCDSNNCIINFTDGASMVLNWNRTSNTFQYMIGYKCGVNIEDIIIADLDYSSTVHEFGYSDPNPDIIFNENSITYIIHLPKEYIGENCFYNVKAVGWGGVSTSDLVGDTVKICGNTPMPAQSLNFGDINCEDVTLTWTDGTDVGYIGDGSDESAGEFYFQAYRADGAGCENYINVSGDLSPSNQNISRSYTDFSGLNEENDYCWKIVAWNPAGSATTSQITVQTPKCPPGPSVLQKDLLSCEKIFLKWKRSENYLFKENAVAYKVYSGTRISPKETLKETMPACRCIDYISDGGCSGFSTIIDGEGTGNCDSDNSQFCANANNCCHTDCAESFFCDGSGSQLKCYNLTDKKYYYREINSDGFTPGGIYHYILEVEPLEIGIDYIDSNQLKIQPCPGLPEWREVGF